MSDPFQQAEGADVKNYYTAAKSYSLCRKYVGASQIGTVLPTSSVKHYMDVPVALRFRRLTSNQLLCLPRYIDLCPVFFPGSLEYFTSVFLALL